MKNYIFLLIFIAQLVVVQAQSPTHIWKGSPTSDAWSLSSNWDCGSNPVTVPDGDSIVEIPVISPSNKYPKLSGLSHAKEVIIKSGATLDIYLYKIIKTDNTPCKIINKGNLRLVGTEEHATWFNRNSIPAGDKISLENNCTVIYYGPYTADIFEGPYENLTLQRDVKASSLTVNKKTLIEQNNVTITSETQNYIGDIEAQVDVTFDTNTNDGTIKFKGEVLAKNTSTNLFKNIFIIKGNVEAKEKIITNKLDVSGESFIADKDIELADNFEGKSKKIETKGLLKAKNINVGATCNNWTSTGNITVEENISADNVNWNANSGNISFKQNLTASKLEQLSGKVIAKGTAPQTIKAKTIKELEVIQTSSSTLVSLNPITQTIKKVINNGTFTISVGANVIISEIENKSTATFSSVTTTLTLGSYINNVGTVNISSLKLLPTGNVVKIEGNNVANKTSIASLSFEAGGGKTLQIKNKIEVTSKLNLIGTSKTSLLKVEGENGGISVSSSLTGEGEFLTVKTNIPIENGTYKTKNSQPEGSESDIQAGKPENWIFNKSLIGLTWKGGATSSPTDWTKDKNWIPRAEPDEESETLIPAGRTYYPVLTIDVKAKSVEIKAGASIDLATFQILTISSAKAKVNNSGQLSFSGTNAQRAWFEAGNIEHKIVLENGSTVAYYVGATDAIYAGPYKNLILYRNVSCSSLTVEDITKINQAITITADDQQYKGRVEVAEDVSFATNADNKTIKFEDEVIAKNNVTNVFKTITITKGIVEAKKKITADVLDISGKSFLAEKEIELQNNFEGKSKKIETKGLLKAKNINIASSSDEWISHNIEITDDITQDGKIWKCNGVVQAKNINVGATCNNWTSTGNITVEENISADNVNWNANSGNISFKQNLTASKLEQLSGKVIAKGTAPQTIKAKTIKELEVIQTSSSTLVSLNPVSQTIGKIINNGIFIINANTDLTITEINNKTNAIFASNAEIKLTKELVNAGSLTISTLSPIGNVVKIEGRANPTDTTISNLIFENAGGKTLEIKNNINVLGHLKLSGLDATHILEVKGPGKIHLAPFFNDKGKFLHIYTNIPLEGATCITEKSKPIGSNAEIQAGKPENWIFDDPVMPLTWEGSIDTSWVNRDNWRPKGLPTEETETIIPKNKTNYPLIVTTDNAKAKVIAIEKNAMLDLSTFLINTSSSKLSKVENNGILKLEGNTAQKAWFEASNAQNKITLQGDSVVLYYGNSTDNIWAGPYEGLTLLRSITASSLTVNKLTKIETSISITSNDQKYIGRVETEEDVSFGTNSENATIKFENEVLAKNVATNTFKTITITKGNVTAKEKITAHKVDVSGKSFLAEKEIELEDNFEGKSKKIETKSLLKAKNINIASSSDEWISHNIEITDDITQDGKIWKCNGVVQAKNINVGATCNNWTSSNNITILENISAPTTQWNATGGNINIFKDCNSPKLEQTQGALILNGNGEQNLTAKMLNRLEMRNTSSPDEMKLKIETVKEFILETGKASLLQDLIITKEFANNGGIFDAFTNEKLVTLKPIDTDTLTIKGKLNISGNPNPPVADTGTKFYQLHCENAGGKTLQFTNAIEILYDISPEGLAQDKKSLILEGASASSKLNIKGNGQIWFNKTPPFPKPKKGGKFLHVASGVQIRGGCYRVISSTHDKPSPRNWIFEEYAQIESTLAINGTNEVCVTFSNKVAKPIADSLKVSFPTSSSFTNMTSISVSSYPKGSNKTESESWFFQFAQNLTSEMFLEKQAVISLGESSLDFIFEKENSDAYPFKKGYISDIGLNLVNPSLAKNTKQIQIFDGTKTLPFINTSLFVDVPQELDGKPLKLYIDTKLSNKYWVPDKTNIPWQNDFKVKQNENKNAAGLSFDVGKSTPDKKMFILPTSIPQLKANAVAGFMLSYDGLPCARLKDQNDIFSFDLWKFDFIGTILQRAGVTVLNNVINVSHDQQVGIEITTKEAGTLTVQIMTLDGNIVKTFVNDYRPGGNYSFYWNGRNEAGRAVARGMYFVRVSGKGVDEVRKILVIHD
ncbi:MAG: FlgD immunoglobulin-like domain containing protein [Treponema sp.]